MSDSPLTDAAEQQAQQQYENDRECGWPPFDGTGFDLARQLETALTATRAQVAALTVDLTVARHDFESAMALNQTLLETQDRNYAKLDDLRAQLDRIPADLYAASGIIVGLREDLALCGRRWISVKDRLPEKTGIYIMTDGTHVHDGNCWVDCGQHTWQVTPVTHWMPMPLPPAPVIDQPQGE